MVQASTVAIGILVTFEFGYFLKFIFHSFTGRFLRSKIHPLASSKVYGICTTRDVDFLLNHINNARFLRAMDFGRLDHISRTRLYAALFKLNATALVAASTVRYRKPVYIFMLYCLETKIIFWDEKNLYFRHDVRTVHDGFLRATGYVKMAVIGNTAPDLMKSLTEDALEQPHCPSDLEAWILYNKKNSWGLKAEEAER